MSTTTFAVVDVETTGLDPKLDRVVEVACLRVCAGKIVERFSSRVNPGRTIPARASDGHGIYDRDVAHAPTGSRSACIGERASRTCRRVISRWIVRSDFDNWPDVRPTAALELGRRGFAQ